MLSHVTSLTAAVALFSASSLSAAAPESNPPFEVKSFDSLSIKSTDVEKTGCKLTHFYFPTEHGVITCTTEDQFKAGWNVAPSLKVTASKGSDGTFVYTITK